MTSPYPYGGYGGQLPGSSGMPTGTDQQAIPGAPSYGQQPSMQTYPMAGVAYSDPNANANGNRSSYHLPTYGVYHNAPQPALPEGQTLPPTTQQPQHGGPPTGAVYANYGSHQQPLAPQVQPTRGLYAGYDAHQPLMPSAQTAASPAAAQNPMSSPDFLYRADTLHPSTNVLPPATPQLNEPSSYSRRSGGHDSGSTRLSSNTSSPICERRRDRRAVVLTSSNERASHVPKLARQPPHRSVDLTAAPSPSKDIRYTSVPKEYSTSAGGPPLSAVDFVGVDDGNTNAKFFRPTSGSAPATMELVKNSCVPFGAVIAPLCRPLHPKEEVPLVVGRAPVRCQRCRGYISCHVQFTGMGRAWVCPLCSMSNDVEENYFCNLDSKGRRLDREEKPELSRGAMEYDVEDFSEYAIRNERDDIVASRPLYHLFLIDISKQALRTFLPDLVAAIRESLHSMAQRTPECRVSFITYASQLHFYNFHHPEIPQLCVWDVDNPFVPLPFTSLCWLTVGENLECIDLFLSRVVEIAGNCNETDCVLGAAVTVAMLVLAGTHAGRVVMSAHCSPQRGVGAVTLREQHKLYGTDKEQELLRPVNGFWTDTATTAAKQQISFDLFMFASDYCDLVTISQVCHVTNGKVFYFSSYDPLIDNTKVTALMTQLMTEEAGYGGMMRVRCSTGVKVSRYRGHFLSQNVHDMDLASVTGTSTFFVDFVPESRLAKDTYVNFQVALLYTTRGGRRRVRILSYRMPVSTSLTSVFGDTDLEATLYGCIHTAVDDAVNKGTKYARDHATERISKMLTNYRRYCTSDSSSSTLLMPSRLKLLPVYTLCLLKSDALAEGTTVRVDDRVQSIYELLSMPAHKLLQYLYPSLFAVHHLCDDTQLGENNAVTGKCILPPRRQLIYDSIAKHGVYVLCDEQARLVYLWIGSCVKSSVSESLFGSATADTVCRPGGTGEDEFSERLRNLLYALMLREDGMRRLIVLHEGEHTEAAFFKQLKEEKESGSVSHDEYLVSIHKTVNRALQ